MLDPAVRGEDEEGQPGADQFAVLGDRLPVGRDDRPGAAGRRRGPSEAEPLGADPVLVQRSPPEPLSPRILGPRGSPTCPSPRSRRDRADLPAAAGGDAFHPPSRARRSPRRRRPVSGSFQSMRYFAASARGRETVTACGPVSGRLRWSYGRSAVNRPGGAASWRLPRATPGRPESEPDRRPRYLQPGGRAAPSRSLDRG